MPSSPMQLLYAQPPDGNPAHGRVEAAPFSSGLNGSTRPNEVVDAEGTRFEAVVLGTQDLVELATELMRRGNWYPVQVDLRDQSYQEPEHVDELSSSLLGYLRTGRSEPALNYLSGPAEGNLFWAVWLTSASMNGTVAISRDGTLRITPRELNHGVVDLVLQSLLSVLADEG